MRCTMMIPSKIQNSRLLKGFVPRKNHTVRRSSIESNIFPSSTTEMGAGKLTGGEKAQNRTLRVLVSSPEHEERASDSGRNRHCPSYQGHIISESKLGSRNEHWWKKRRTPLGGSCWGMTWLYTRRWQSGSRERVILDDLVNSTEMYDSADGGDDDKITDRLVSRSRWPRGFHAVIQRVQLPAESRRYGPRKQEQTKLEANCSCMGTRRDR